MKKKILIVSLLIIAVAMVSTLFYAVTFRSIYKDYYDSSRYCNSAFSYIDINNQDNGLYITIYRENKNKIDLIYNIIDDKLKVSIYNGVDYSVTYESGVVSSDNSNYQENIKMTKQEFLNYIIFHNINFEEKQTKIKMEKLTLISDKNYAKCLFEFSQKEKIFINFPIIDLLINFDELSFYFFVQTSDIENINKKNNLYFFEGISNGEEVKIELTPF